MSFGKADDPFCKRKFVGQLVDEQASVADKTPVANSPKINQRFIVTERTGVIVEIYADGTCFVKWDDGSVGHLTKEFCDDWCALLPATCQ